MGESELRYQVSPNGISVDMPKGAQDSKLVGWKRIAEYLGQPVATAQRWAALDGMPVKREGRYVEASPDELQGWLGRESGTKQPVHMTHAEEKDLAVALKRGLRTARAGKKQAA
jgi:hypothetical protein